MKPDFEKTIDLFMEGNKEAHDELSKLLKDEKHLNEYVNFMVDEMVFEAAFRLEEQERNFKNKNVTKRHKIMFFSIAAIAAAASIILGFIILPAKFNSGYVVQIIKGNTELKIGDKLKAGAILNIGEKEEVIIQFNDKSELALHGPFQGSLLENGIYIEKGYLDATVEKQINNNFVINTPQSNITVVGTAFSTSVIESSTELAVKEGKVKIDNKSESLMVEPNQFILVSKSTPFKVYSQSEKNLPLKILSERNEHKNQKLSESLKLKLVSPEADTYIGDGSYRHRSFGSEKSLIVLKDPGGESLTNIILLRFDLSNLPPSIISAKLRLFTSKVSANSGKAILNYVNEDSWKENLVKFSTGPSISKEPILDWSPVEGDYFEADLTSLVQNDLNGDRKISLAIRAKKEVKRSHFEFPSREHENEEIRPVLIIEYK